MGDVLISIVNYRSFGKTEKAVESIYDRSTEKYSKRIVIVDNSVDKEEAEKLVGLKARFPEIELVFSENNDGFGKGHNLAFNRFCDPDTKFFVILNPDVVLENDAVGIMKAYLEEHPECAMTIPRLLKPEGGMQKAYRRELTVRDMFIRSFTPHLFKKRSAYHTMQDMDYSQPFKVPFAQGSFLMIRSEIYRELGGFDDRFFLYLEDADLCRRVNMVSEINYVPAAKAVHVWEKASGKNLKLFMIHLGSMIKYFRKGS